MIQIIALSVGLVISLFILNSFFDHVCGLDSAGNFSKALEGTLTIVFLYLIIIAVLGAQLMSNGIPFVDQLDDSQSLTALFREKPSVFILECAELISLTFLISFITSLIPGNFGGAGLTGTIIRKIVLVLIGIIANNYFLAIVRQTVFFSWGITALQCFFSGTALLMTPAVIIGNLLHLDAKSKIVLFLVQKLPQTKVGKAMSTSASNSILLVLVIMIFESQFGSIVSVLSELPVLIAYFGCIALMIIGIRLMIKAAIR